MHNIWKILSAVLFIACILLGYLLFKYKSNTQVNGTLNIGTDYKKDSEYKKKQNPEFAADNNDLFYQKPTVISFIQDVYDFDTILSNKVIIRDIQFVNTGKNPYFITDIKVSCGCTIPSYDNRPIAPGDTGIVKIEYNSAKKNGFNMNKLSVFGNTDPRERSVYFKFFVKRN